jgi:hypothetical protein
MPADLTLKVRFEMVLVRPHPRVRGLTVKKTPPPALLGALGSRVVRNTAPRTDAARATKTTRRTAIRFMGSLDFRSSGFWALTTI